MKIPSEILAVAQHLGEHRSEVVFLGGMVRGLLVTDPSVPGVRPTKDVDVIVDSASAVKHAEFVGRLRSLGFREDLSEDAPICRYLLRGAGAEQQDLPVDVMPIDADILGFSNRWYAGAFNAASTIESPVGSLRVIDAPHYLATKLESFFDRGAGDYYHHDLEDVIVLVDGRAELAGEIRQASAALRQFCAGAIARLLADPDFVAALPGHLPPDAPSQGRLPQLRIRLEALSRLDSI